MEGGNYYELAQGPSHFYGNLTDMQRKIRDALPKVFLLWPHRSSCVSLPRLECIDLSRYLDVFEEDRLKMYNSLEEQFQS